MYISSSERKGILKRMEVSRSHYISTLSLTAAHFRVSYCDVNYDTLSKGTNCGQEIQNTEKVLHRFKPQGRK
jgi:hypothetical protein